MSMTVEERRVEVLREDSGAWGKLRIAKASSRYDKRYRYLVVEWCPPPMVGDELEEWSYQVLRDWHPAGSSANRTEADAFFAGARMAFLTQQT